MHPRMMVCCVSPRCCTTHLQGQSPSPDKLLTVDVSNPIVSRSAPFHHTPAATHPLHPQLQLNSAPPLSDAHLDKCTSCLCDLCCCQAQQTSARSTDHSQQESSLDIDLNDPMLLQALEECINSGSGSGNNPTTLVNITPEDINNRLKNIDFISMFFQTQLERQATQLPPNDPALPTKANPPPLAVYPQNETGNPLELSRSWSSDISSSLPSSYHLQRTCRLVAPTNSLVDKNESLQGEGSESENRNSTGILHKVPVDLPKQFTTILNSVLMESNLNRVNCIPRQTNCRKHVHRKRGPYSIRIFHRHSLGNRPPCLGQEQSPIRSSPGAGQDNPPSSSKVPACCGSALTPNGMDHTLVYQTPSQTHNSSLFDMLPTVRRRFRISSNFTSEQEKDESILITHTHMRQEQLEDSGTTGNILPLEGSYIPVMKNSAEKVRHWLQRLQDVSSGTSTPISSNKMSSDFQRDFCGESSLSSLASKNIPPCHKHRVRRRKIFPHQKYLRLLPQIHFMPDRYGHRNNNSCESQGNKIPDDEKNGINAEDISSSRIFEDELSSSGFLADRSSTTRSSIKTSSNCDQNFPLAPEKQSLAWLKQPVSDEIVCASNVYSETSSQPDHPSYSFSQGNEHQVLNPNEDLNVAIHTVGGVDCGRKSAAEPKCLQIVNGFDEGSATWKRPSISRRCHILKRSLKQMGRQLPKRTDKVAYIKTLAVL